MSIFNVFAVASVADWEHLTILFQRKDILKLGYDPHQDMHMLRPILPGFHGGFVGAGFIDLRAMVPSLVKQLPDILGELCGSYEILSQLSYRDGQSRSSVF